MVEPNSETRMFHFLLGGNPGLKEVLQQVHQALVEKGYDPVGQMVGYLLSGDPTFITSHNNARDLIIRFDRDAILEEMVVHYLVK